ncbi:cell agglutination protein Mam3 [Paecilomyces lecythidis]|uniref:Cell agglutination protein Mam3 n=1 Tax=Paecilomyces lecythidis TaxID=3004212 RepID=A0ABR3WXI5_9EURO
MHSSHVNPYVARRPAILGLAKVLLIAVAQLPIITAAPTPFFGVLSNPDEDAKPPNDPELWLYLAVAAALVLAGGAFAGLTIALMGQDEIYLQVIKTSGEGAEKKNAASVLKLLQKGKHWVLVTLLLSNVITNETLPIILDRSLGGGWPAVVGSTVLIVIFGEIVPQSICVRYGLPIGAWMAPCVLILMYIMSPVAWPVAKLLDYLLGEDHGTIYKKAGLKTLVTLHKTLGEAGEQLNSDEVTIISAVLDLKEKSVGSIMTPMEDVFTMSADAVLDEPTMDLILSQGYSRIPIHAPDNPQNFVGMLLVKMLITYDPEDARMVRDFALATLPETRAETSCLDIVNFFQEGKSHMVLVSEYPGEDHGALGVVTLEDVIEELIGEEIIDESDVFIDVHKAIRRLNPAPKSRVPKGRIVEEPPSQQEPTLIDLGDKHAHSLPKDTENGTPEPPRRPSFVEAPPPRFLLRRQTGDATHETVARVGTTDEIREHLKHLGPSNLASNPRQTRYQSVKIKPGASPTRSGDSGRRVSEDQPKAPASVQYQGGSGAGIIQTAGTDAKDGVQALKSGYGTMTDRPPTSNDAPSQVSNSAQGGNARSAPKVNIPEAVEEVDGDDSRGSQNSRPVSSESGLSDHLRPNYQCHGPARSGSITEQVVDVNGVKKVVLQTNSGASSDTERQPDTHAHQNGNKRDTNKEPDESDGGSHVSGQTVSKKRRRRKKRNTKSKHSGDGERQPLLDR